MKRVATVVIHDLALVGVCAFLLLVGAYFFIEANGLYNNAATLVGDNCFIAPPRFEPLFMEVEENGLQRVNNRTS